MDLSRNKTPKLGVPLPWILIAAVGIIVGGILIGLTTPLWFPAQASAEAQSVDRLFQVLLTIGGAIFLLVQGMIIYSVIRFRVRADDPTDGPNIHGNTTLEVIWTAIPAVIVFFLVIYSWVVWTEIRSEKPNEMEVQVLAQRFNWNFTYTDPDNRLANRPENEQTFSSNVLHTYVNQPMLLRMNTPDVNHAFWVPTMRIKQDVLVGRETEVRFTPTRPGRYRVVCAELCGSGHGAMYTYIIVHESRDVFMRDFADIAVNNIINPPSDPVLVGQRILETNVYPCSGCHQLESLEGWVGNSGPNLNGIGSRAADRAAASGLASAEEYLAHSIRHPNDYIVPGFVAGLMPQFGATEDPVGAVNGASYVYMPDDHLTGIVAYLCTQTESGAAEDTACGDIESIRAAVIAQSE
jgi:cytochrome c oxidase subunit II